jgi:hypothetical protein
VKGSKSIDELLAEVKAERDNGRTPPPLAALTCLYPPCSNPIAPTRTKYCSIDCGHWERHRRYVAARPGTPPRIVEKWRRYTEAAIRAEHEYVQRMASRVRAT